MVQQEISTLHTQLAKVRSGKHQAETERAECGKIQDEMIQKLQARVQELVGSLGSDAGEHIRRAMDSPPVNLGREIMGLEIHVSAARSVGVESVYSVGVGSAQSVLHREFGSGGMEGQGVLMVTAIRLCCVGIF